MSAAFLASYWVLWALVIVLSVLVFALARQVGVLHERVAPAGALSPTNGPKVGELTELAHFEALDGGQVAVGGMDEADLSTLVLFVSPTCPVCKTLVPTAQSLAGHERRRMRLIFASDGDTPDRHRAYAGDQQISASEYVVSQALGLSYAVSKLPFAVLIRADGTLAGKGLVNNREHLESLVESMDSGVRSLQEFVNMHDAENEAASSGRSK